MKDYLRGYDFGCVLAVASGVVSTDMTFWQGLAILAGLLLFSFIYQAVAYQGEKAEREKEPHG